MKKDRMRYAYSMNAVYQAVGVSKQSVYQYSHRRSLFEEKLEALRCEVELIRREHGGCGLEKLYHMLCPDWIGRDRFISIFQGLGYGLKRKKKGMRTTFSDRRALFSNLIEGMLVDDLNLIWQSDITYYWVNGDFYYLTFILDVYSRRILGYAVSDSLRTQASQRALAKALELRKQVDLSRLIHHSDRGSQYMSKAYLEQLADRNIHTISVSETPQQNAYSERVNGIIKNEYLAHKNIDSYQQLNREVDKAVKHYNAKRPHRSLWKRMSPEVFEKWISLNTDNRPRTIIYAEGQIEFNEANKPNKLYPKTDALAPFCLKVY